VAGCSGPTNYCLFCIDLHDEAAIPAERRIQTSGWQLRCSLSITSCEPTDIFVIWESSNAAGAITSRATSDASGTPWHGLVPFGVDRAAHLEVPQAANRCQYAGEQLSQFLLTAFRRDNEYRGFPLLGSASP